MVVFQARSFASHAHRNQRRRYTGELYITHCEEVAVKVATIKGLTPTQLEKLMAIAYLHDTVEDTDTTYENLVKAFGGEIADGVRWLTDCDLKEGNRAARKAIDRERLSRAPRLIQAVKCSDIMSNIPSIAKHDKGFAMTYIAEVESLLMVMGTENHRPPLWWEAYECVKKAKEDIQDTGDATEVLEVRTA